MISTTRIIKQLMTTLDLNMKEASIYIELLQRNSATAHRIARNTDINRTTVYDVLQRLMNLGIVSKQKKGSATFFAAADPGEIYTLIEHQIKQSEKTWNEKKKKLSTLIPELEHLVLPGAPTPSVTIFEGLRGIESAYEKTLTAKSEIVAYVDVQAEVSALPHYFPEYWKRRTKKRIPIRSILINNDAGKERHQLDLQELRRSKLLPSSARSFTAQLKIWDNTLLSISWEEQIATLVESKNMAQMQKIIFDSLWDTLPPGQSE